MTIGEDLVDEWVDVDQAVWEALVHTVDSEWMLGIVSTDFLER